MKLRIRGDSLRLRLKREEVEKIASGQSVIERTRFPDSELIYRLDVSSSASFAAHFDADGLTIEVPTKMIAEWAESDQVSMLGEQQLGDHDSLTLLIEKDFSCLAPGDHRQSDDDSDTFPHPEAVTGQGC